MLGAGETDVRLRGLTAGGDEDSCPILKESLAGIVVRGARGRGRGVASGPSPVDWPLMSGCGRGETSDLLLIEYNEGGRVVEWRFDEVVRL